MTRNNLRKVMLRLKDSRQILFMKDWLIKTAQSVSGNSTRFCSSVVKDVAMVYCAWYTFTNLVGFPAAVSGKSMQPTLNPGHTRLGVLDSDWVWVNCWRARRYKMARGDLLVYTSPKDPEEYLIKRMIAGEGDVVHTEGRHSKAVVRVPQGHVWAEGDNWGNSVDSNMYGPVPKVGRECMTIMTTTTFLCRAWCLAWPGPSSGPLAGCRCWRCLCRTC